MPGVYMILCLPTLRFYIGGTKSRYFSERYANHKIALRKGEGPPLLQAEWDRHGETAFRFFPIELAARGDVRERESVALWELRPALNAIHTLGREAGRRGVSLSTAHDRYRKGRDPFVWIGGGRPRKSA